MGRCVISVCAQGCFTNAISTRLAGNSWRGCTQAMAALVIPVPAFKKQVLMAESFEEYLNSAIDLEARLKEVRRKMSRLYEDMDGELK